MTFPAASMSEPKRTHHKWKHQSLSHERYEDDRECQKENFIPIGEKTTVRRGEGNRECRSEGDDAPHTGEGQRKGPLPGRRRIVSCDGRNQPTRKISRRKHPEETGRN